MDNTIELARRALEHLSSDDRTTWIRMGAALKSQFGDSGFDIWNDWSSKSPKYNEKVAQQQWRTLQPGRINIGTLFYEAKQQGFVFGNSKKKTPAPKFDKDVAQSKRAQEQADQERFKAEQEAAVAARNRLDSGSEINMSHPYLKKKGMSDFTFLKRYLKQDDKNNLIVPIKRLGDIKGCQRITYTGQKFLEKGMFLEASSLIIGKWGDVKEKGVIVAEGLATGASIYAATGRPVMVAFVGANLPHVCRLLRGTSNRNIFVAADNDEAGLRYAAQAREKTFGEAVILKPSFTDQQIKDFESKKGTVPTDFNDYYQINGLAKLKENINSQIAQAQRFLFKKNLTEVQKNLPSQSKNIDRGLKV